MAERFRSARQALTFLADVGAQGARTSWSPHRLAHAVLSLGFAGTLLVTSVHAQDHGPTIPLATFLVDSGSAESPSQGPTFADLTAAFPVATSPPLRRATLRPGARMNKQLSTWLRSPIALVVDDVASRDWLKEQSEALRQMRAAVLVVRVASKEAMSALRAAAPSVKMAAADASNVAHELAQIDSAVYPIVILADGSLHQDLRPFAKPPQAAAAR
jgi:integrating conjugative element protein (TIGR03765 family)